MFIAAPPEKILASTTWTGANSAYSSTIDFSRTEYATVAFVCTANTASGTISVAMEVDYGSGFQQLTGATGYTNIAAVGANVYQLGKTGAVALGSSNKMLHPKVRFKFDYVSGTSITFEAYVWKQEMLP